MLDLTKLAKQHLEDAITLGYIRVGGEILNLRASEILAISRYIIKEGLVNETNTSENKSSMPLEMFKPTLVKSNDLEEED